MKAKEYFETALGGNMNINTLKVIVFEEIMTSFAKIKCKEQREICAKIKGFGHEMKNAKEPDFE